MPSEEKSRPSSDEQIATKLQGVMMKLGGQPDLKQAPDRTDDEFRRHMWQLMGVSDN